MIAFIKKKLSAKKVFLTNPSNWCICNFKRTKIIDKTAADYETWTDIFLMCLCFFWSFLKTSFLIFNYYNKYNTDMVA